MEKKQRSWQRRGIFALVSTRPEGEGLIRYDGFTDDEEEPTEPGQE
ncbi:MAG: hypothetical protein IJ662_00185 [Clostridia bacterium]|nr:hypothetical protein [Clostridia bacterium]